MPNCTPTIHSAESLRDLVSVIQPKAHADFCVWGLALGDANLASLPALAEAGCVAFKFFWGYAVDHRDNSLIYNYREGMDNVLPPPDDGQIYRLFRAVKTTGKRLGIHAENFSIVRALTQEALAAGAQDYAALLRTRPVSCETSIIDTAIDMAKELSMPLHVLHVGVGDGVEHLRRAKADGVDVTAETCTHYLTFTDEDLQEDGRFKMNPPLRAREDRDALIEGLLDGTIDMLVTDHAPHSREEKARGLEKSAMGVVGLETSFAASYTALVQTGILPLEKLVDLMHGAPMRRFGCGTELAEGQPADLTAFDLTKTYTVDPETFLTMGRATPFAGCALTGVCKLTMIGGEPVWKEETL